MQKVGYDCRIMGVPKTIDNDLFGTDHCPGFASAAKYIATSYRRSIPGRPRVRHRHDHHHRDHGPSRRLAGRLLPLWPKLTGCGPDLIYLPEADFDMEEFLADVSDIYAKNKNCIVAVSEGIHYADGTFVSEAKTSATDGFGHAQLGGLAALLADVVKEKTGAKVRGIELSLLQRCGAHVASGTDIEESYRAGKTAVEAAVSGVTDKMVAFACTRTEDGGYRCDTKLLDLSSVANYEKKVPVEWINERGNDISDEFIRYALPLIQGETGMVKENGLPRFAKLKKVRA